MRDFPVIKISGVTQGTQDSALSKTVLASQQPPSTTAVSKSSTSPSPPPAATSNSPLELEDNVSDSPEEQAQSLQDLQAKINLMDINQKKQQESIDGILLKFEKLMILT